MILVFVFSQIIGLLITNQYISVGEEIAYKELPFNMERPEIEENYTFIYIMIGVLLGTGLLLLLIKFKKSNLWKFWYGIAVALALTVSLAGFIDEKIALSFALVLTLFKIYKPNVIVHNITEVLIYGGIAAIFVPIINTFSAIMLLILISIYDAYAVWKSKHMVKMANFQTKSKLFAGLSIPYSMKKVKSVKEGKKSHLAILGGGDIAFPLIFTAVIMKEFILSGMAVEYAFLKVLIITFFTTVALALLLFTSKKGKFYPAMPFISAGCFIGYVIVLI